MLGWLEEVLRHIESKVSPTKVIGRLFKHRTEGTMSLLGAQCDRQTSGERQEWNWDQCSGLGCARELGLD